MSLNACLQYASAFFALIAALLWLRSSTIKVPKIIRSVDLGWLDGSKEDDDMDRLTTGLYNQSRFSAWGAAAASLAAVIQAIAISIPS